MGEVFGRRTMKLLAGVVGVSLVASSVMAQMQGEPPGRVGRLAFVDGTVSFHDDEERGWTKAIVNTPLTRPPGMPDEVWGIVRVALAKDPSARFQTARASPQHRARDSQRLPPA